MKTRREVRAVIFDEKNSEKKILLIKRWRIYYPPSWRLVKGGIKKNETEEQALKREIYEELGLENCHILDKLGESQYYVGGQKCIISSYAVRVNSSKPIKYDPREVCAYHWFTPDEAIRKLMLDDERKSVRLLE